MTPRLLLLFLLITLWPSLGHFFVSPAQAKLDAVLSASGALGARNLQVEFSGELERSSGEREPFTLSVLRGNSRFQSGVGVASRTLLRRGERTQRMRGGGTEYEQASTYVHSTLNFLPALALDAIRRDVGFAYQVVADGQGLTGLQFTREMPEGSVDRRHSFRACRVTFWLDAADRVQQVIYEDLNGGSGPVSYAYRYDKPLTGPLSQPSRVDITRPFGKPYTSHISAVTTAVADNSLFQFDPAGRLGR